MPDKKPTSPLAGLNGGAGTDKSNKKAIKEAFLKRPPNQMVTLIKS
jgi:hypothetical protein